MDSIKRDLRLYEYDTGQLLKVGRGKTGPRPHIFSDFEICKNHINFLREKYKAHEVTQFIIVEYFGPYNSRIIQILDC